MHVTQKVPSHQKVKIKAESEADMNVISALLEAALVPAMSLRHDPDNKKMSAMVMRYVWENAQDHTKVPEERVNAGVMVHHVEQVRHQNMDPAAHAKKVYQLQRVRHLPGALELVFEGGQALHIDVSKHAVYLYDLDEPWPAHQPQVEKQGAS